VRNPSSAATCVGVALAAASFATPLLAQTDTTAHQSHWYDALSIRQTFDEQYASRPATFQYLNAVHDSTVLSVAAAVRYLFSTDYLKGGPTLEYQRTTSPTKPQDVLRIGGTGNAQVWAFEDPESSHIWTPLLLGQVNFKHDAVLHKYSFQTSASSTALFRHCRVTTDCFYRPDQLTFTPVIAFRYLPYLGAEYEHYFGATPGGPDVVRGLMSVQSQYYPAPRILDYRLQLTMDYAYRRSSTVEPGFPNRDHHLFTAAANLFLLKRTRESDPNKTVGLTVAYSKGDDPSKGLPVQEITKAGVTVQF
jgi:hypothetical protein